MPPDARDLLDRLCAPVGDPRPAPRLAVVAAHPDDEVIGLGARFPRLAGSVTFAHATDGSPRDLYDARNNGFATREEYARCRRGEMAAALRLAGMPDADACTREMNIADQETCRNLAPLARRLAELLEELRPEAVITHPYEGGHPDHDGTAFAVHAALELLARRGAPVPVLLELTSYHNSPAGIRVGEFLDESAGGKVVTCLLSDEQRAFKQSLLDCFPTQKATLDLFPPSVERFRVAPRYDFTRPPHAGQLFYEGFSWGMTGETFRTLAIQAREELGLAPALAGATS